ncbi:hypothetical protein Gorai_021246 [Gossypium raimondii]|uniref:Uncharacterized protein n=1 Tax=Gossypium raimondii TaxID=29730 RepID=A0A7J8NPS8_GOSRA|nr:hypothetical protein [Gossypium raimondii]
MEDEIAGLTLYNDENDVWSVPPGASKLAAKFDFNLMEGLFRATLRPLTTTYWCFIDWQIGNFLGIFLDYYSTALGFGLQQCLRIRVFVDVRIPFEQKKRRCENFCPLRLTLATKKVSMGWDMSLRAMPHRLQAQCSVWLRNVPVERPYGDLNDSSNADDRSTVMVDFSKSLKDHPMTIVGGKKRARFTSIVSIVFTGSDSTQALHIFYAAGSVE